MTDRTSIFIVDDDKEDQAILGDYFNEVGIAAKVLYFENGEMAINFLDAIHDDEHLPRLIVLDLNMPILNGTQTLLYLKREPRYKKIPVIIFSTAENENERRKCLSYGAVDYLVKPMTYDEGRKIAAVFAAYL
jgi:CheY-like chemotaxis protein